MRYTDSQLEAIDHKDGNLKIIACAGSGKTTVMSERIAKLISEGENRDKIVAFTYTEKAAKSLKFNIRKALNDRCPDSAYLGSMYIGTIHAFALEKLKDLIPRYRSFDILDEVKRIIWVSKKYNQLGLEDIRQDTRYFDAIQRFLRSADIIRENEFPYEKLNQIPQFKAVYERYLQLLDEDKYLDFSGIIYKLVEILESDEKLLNEVRDSVKYLVVDEYQDINPMQEKLVSFITGKDGNLCVVGDDDQSIFEFQGAEVNNIIQFEQRYNNVYQVKLEENFRCPKEIIEAGRELIRRNGHRIQKSMKPGKIEGKIKTSEDGDVCKLEFEAIHEEVDFVIKKIQEMRGCEYTDEGVRRGLDYGDMAIIVRTRLSAQRFIEPLRRAGIRFTFRGTGGLFQRPEINFLRHLFCYYANTGIDYHSPVITIMDIKDQFNSLGFSHLTWEDIAEKIVELKEMIRSTDTSNPDTVRRRIFLQKFYYEILKTLKVDANNFTEDVMYDFGRLSSLIAEFEFVHGWINYYYFTQFVNFISGYAHDKTDEGGLDDPRNTNSVNIITVHKAKGLEFPVVFIPDLSVRRFPSQNRNRSPATHFNNDIFDLNRYCSGDEGERRLFYVASTRTKKFLFITRSKVGDTGSSVSRSGYYTEFDHEIMITENVPDPTTRNNIQPQCIPNMELMPTSYSDLRHYINCPYSYLLQQLMGFSPVINLAYGYGLQVHGLLNYTHKEWLDVPPSVEWVESLVEDEFFLRYTTGGPFDQFKKAASRILRTYVEEYGHEFPLRLETEKPFELIMGGAMISGSIDLIQKIDPVSKEVIDVSILDFKTEKEKWETKPFIRQQLRLYALAGDKALGLNPRTAKIHYLTDNFRQDIDISQDKLNETKSMIEGIITKIKSNEFEPCSGNACNRCDMTEICCFKQS